jgi:hypothetical protein
VDVGFVKSRYDVVILGAGIRLRQGFGVASNGWPDHTHLF